MTKEQKQLAIREAWDGMEKAQTNMELVQSDVHKDIYHLLYKIFWILYRMLTSKTP